MVTKVSKVSTHKFDLKIASVCVFIEGSNDKVSNCTFRVELHARRNPGIDLVLRAIHTYAAIRVAAPRW